MRIIFLLLMCLCLTSCTMVNTWTIKADGKDIKGTYQIAGGEAGKANFEFYRLLILSTYKMDVERLKAIQEAIKK